MNKYEIGFWDTDRAGLPCFHYTGALPYRAFLKNGTEVKLPEDPWFLLGNYQLTLFAHISGEYELITGQRAWGRMNQGKQKNSGDNRSVLTVERGGESRTIALTGLDSVAALPTKCKRSFGCGYAAYEYRDEGLRICRKLSVRPSGNPHGGTSAFLLEVSVRNEGNEDARIVYMEAVRANYREIQFQSLPPEQLAVTYTNEYDSPKEGLGVIHIIGHSEDPLFGSDRDRPSVCEGFPPALFLRLLTEGGTLTEREGELCGTYSFVLAPGQELHLAMIIGFSVEDKLSEIETILEELQGAEGEANAFADDWKRVLPDFADEADAELRGELIWHAYTLEAMATYSRFFGETKIPQGTIYDYDWGAHASARDHFQHALPLVYYNPALAKSVLRYLLLRTTPYGEIRLMEKGCGYCSNERYFTSDQQLFFFLLLAEYLRVTGDYAFLWEKVDGRELIFYVRACFTYLKDEVGVGRHGIVRLLNSDWNDAVYYIVKAPYNQVVLDGESHMNSAMAVSVLQKLIPQLRAAHEAKEPCPGKEELELLIRSMSVYRERIRKAFEADLGDRAFPRRMYFNGEAYGEDNMFLEPAGYTLWIDELGKERKRLLYAELTKRLDAGEKLGAREQEAPEFEDEGFDKGSRENGGFWWALNGPLILGVAGFDRAEAWRRFHNMTLKHYAEEFPQYWSSYWSAADQAESSLIPEEGLPDQSFCYADSPVYCAHPHAWILYCYYVLKEGQK